MEEPPEASSHNGILDLKLKLVQSVDEAGLQRYCYLSDTGVESPTLRLAPGDQLAIHFENGLPASLPTESMPAMAMGPDTAASGDPCHGAMTTSATNLHFHGVVLPPVCHQDESIHTLIAPGQTFDYRTRIPDNHPPGLYWYHPHPHGFSTRQVQGGASGAIIVEGIDSYVPVLQHMTKRTFILRDQLIPNPPDLTKTPDAPSWDVSINYVPIKYPQYVPARLEMEPEKKQLWRVVNAAANTIFNLQVVYDGIPQKVAVYAIDGVPLQRGPIEEESVLLPPGARAEFVVTGPKNGQTARLVTLKFDAGPTGDSAPARPLANIAAVKTKNKRDEKEALPPNISIVKSVADSDLSGIIPVRTRNLYFSQNGNGTEGGAGAADKFYITVVGQPVKSFDMDGPPNIVARAGTVEDWNIWNSTPEDHIFHIHQVHFQLIAVNGVAVNDPVIRDTIRVPHQVGRTPISTIKVRLDFRDPNIVGRFVYHCHILDHEDKGMMGSIEIVPRDAPAGVENRPFPRSPDPPSK